MSIEKEKNKILGDFIRSRRERMRPEIDSMVSRFGRRRTPGLRREEVASLAGVSVTWYTWLEQGRVVTTSREVIESVGRALQLSPEENLHLLRLANYHIENEAYPNSEEINTVLQAIIDQLQYPAIIANHRTEVLAYNRGASEIIVDFNALPASQRIMTRLIFTDPNLRQRIVNWEEFANYAVGICRSYYDHNLGEPWYEQFVQQMCQENEEFLTLWRQHDVQHKKAIPYTFDHPVAGRLFLQINTFNTINGNENLHCCVFAPAANTDTIHKLVDLNR